MQGSRVYIILVMSYKLEDLEVLMHLPYLAEKDVKIQRISGVCGKNINFLCLKVCSSRVKDSPMKHSDSEHSSFGSVF